VLSRLPGLAKLAVWTRPILKVTAIDLQAVLHPLGLLPPDRHFFLVLNPLPSLIVHEEIQGSR
ncbi:MAG: hypothetical protein ACK53L_14385, partial [Pirellulaceae bacterium]